MQDTLILNKCNGLGLFQTRFLFEIEQTELQIYTNVLQLLVNEDKD